MLVLYSIFTSVVLISLVLSITSVVLVNSDYLSLPPVSSQQSNWMKETSMPLARSEAAGTTLNGKLYIIGGFDNTGESTSTVAVYDPVADKWATSAPLPQPIDHTSVTSNDGKLYVVGGGYSEALSNKLFIYDPAANNWTEGANMPTARGALTANFINETLYAIGGIDNAGTSNINQAYDPKTNTWTEKAPMPTAREHLASAVVDGNLYAIGGRQTDNDSPKANFNRVEMYNPANDSWTIIEQMPTKRSGIAAAVSPVDNNIYVFGGENPFINEGPKKTFDVVERYNPKTNIWTTVESMPTGRHGLAAMTADGKIYVISGGNKPGLSVSNVNEVLLLEKDK